MPTPDRRTVIALLERHGVPSAGAQALRQWGVDLRDRTLRTKQELAIILHAETGEVLGDLLSGTGDQVDADPLLRRMQADERYISVHTHPGGQSFSAHDAAVLVAHAQRLIVVAVVGAQGVWYILSVDPDRSLASPGDVYDTFFREHDTLAATYAQLVQDGTLTRREAQRQHSHAIWEHIAPDLGLRYDRA